MKIPLLAIWLLGVIVCRGENVLTDYKWKDSKRAGPFSGTVLPNGVLKIENTNNSALRVELLKIEKPPITAMFYGLRGQIKYEGVQGDGFLEMWNVFPPVKLGGDEGRFFSRTMDVSGELGKVTGSSDWRSFQLPFNRNGTATPPDRLEINLILPGAGTVFIGPMNLVEYKGGFGGNSQAWWSERTAGVIGGTVGAILGCLGSLMAMLAAKQKARRFVFISAYFLIGIGCALSIAGIVAVVSRQPYSVWFPLILGAILLLSLMPSRLRDFRRSYEDRELRKMTAFDAGRA